MATAHCEPEVDPVDSKRLRKKKKRFANEVAEEPAVAEEANPDEAKRLRKVARKAANAAAAADAEAKRLRKAAKKATKQDEAAEDEDEGVPVGKTELEPAAEVGPAGKSEALDEFVAKAKRVEPADEVATVGESEPFSFFEPNEVPVRKTTNSNQCHQTASISLTLRLGANLDQNIISVHFRN